MDDRAKKLELGISKQEAIKIMGNNYFIEFLSQNANKQVEVLHFRSIYYNEYLLHFIDGRLFEFHKYIPPSSTQRDVHVIKEGSF